MNIDTQMMTVEEYAGAVQLLGILLYFLLPTLVLIVIIYGIRKMIRRNKTRKSKNSNINKANKNNGKPVVIDINKTSDKELLNRINKVEERGKPERIGSLTLTFDKDGKIEH